MAVLLNQTSNLRFRIELLRRLSDGTTRPASLEMRVGLDRYQHRAGSEHAFVPMLDVPRATLLDMDLIQFLQALEQLLERLEELDQVHVQERGARHIQHGDESVLAAGAVLVTVETHAHLQRRRPRRAVRKPAQQLDAEAQVAGLVEQHRHGWSCYMRALHATPAAADAVGRPLLPLLDRVRRLAARVRLFRSAALVV